MFKKRSGSFEVEILTNGFVISLTGRDENDDWKTEKIYCMDLQLLHEIVESYVELVED